MSFQTLKDWASQGKLSEASLSDDGSSLKLGDASLDGKETLSIEHNGKSCSYSVASIYLQIKNPSQGLMSYRGACKKHSVTDPVTALHKAVVVGFFLGDQQAPAASADAAPALEEPEEAVAAESQQKPTEEAAAAAQDKKSPSSSKRHHDKDRKRKHSRDKHRDKHRKGHRDKKKKKSVELVTNEQLFSNLNVVVDKRQMEARSRTQQAITSALSAEGFSVTPQTLQDYKEAAQDILQTEIAVGNSASILRAVNPQKNLARVLELYLETVNPKSSSKPGGSSSASKSGSKPVPPPKPKKSHLIGKKPVILVPKGMTAPITLINAHEFLANGRFVERKVMMTQGRHRNPQTTFTRSIKSRRGAPQNMEYEIIDNPRKLGTNIKEWDRIVAVIVLGQAWQFKDWPPPYNDPVHLFARTFGFFVSMEGDKLPADLQKWRVKQCKLNRDKRGLDSITYTSFWMGLDEWMSVHKRELLPQAEE